MPRSKPPGCVTVAALARQLGTDPSSIYHHVEAGRIPAPSHPGRKRVYYSREDVAVIQKFWAERVPCGCSRFTQDDVKTMRSMWEGGLRQEEIASHFGTSQREVSDLLTGRILPGWRGGETGQGRKKTKLVNRRRNAPVIDAIGRRSHIRGAKSGDD